MQYEALVLSPSGKTIMCWISDCGRYYSRLLGYFYLHRLAETGNHVDEETRSARACVNEDCAGKRFMALVYDTDPAGARTGHVPVLFQMPNP
jgi:hypothetical protein